MTYNLIAFTRFSEEPTTIVESSDLMFIYSIINLFDTGNNITKFQIIQIDENKNTILIDEKVLKSKTRKDF